MSSPEAQESTRRREIADLSARLFRKRGYRETSIREIAAAAGIKSASLYYYFADKDDILFAIAHGLMEDFVAEVTPLLDPERDSDPAVAIAGVVAAHLRFDARRLDEVLVSARERRSLPPDRQRPINRLRARHRAALAARIEQGIASGAFAVTDADVAANAVLDLLSGVKEWHRPRPRGRLDQIVEQYEQFTLALLRAGAARPPPAGGVSSARRRTAAGRARA
jgi:AcrR family transcriptional regulator